MRIPGKPLENPRHEIFCRHYAIHGNKSEAAAVAGYSEESRGQQGYRMSKKAQIQARIEEIRGWKLKHADISDEELLTHVADVALNAEREADQIQASKLIMQARGIAQKPEKTRKDLPSIGTLKQYVINITHNHEAEPVTIDHEPVDALQKLPR